MKKNNIEQQREKAMAQYHQLIQTILKNVIKVGSQSAKAAFVVLDCREQHKMDIFYYQDNWMSSQQFENADKLLSQAPQIINYIDELFKNVDIAKYSFIQLRYHYHTQEWQSHFVWQDEASQTPKQLSEFVQQWQLRMNKDIQQW